jgi:UDP-N-acetyl-D-galactosamine dehydrogenase
MLLFKTEYFMITVEQLKKGGETVAVVGLGYVGLPLAVGMAEHFPVLGFDVNRERVEQLKRRLDHTGEVEVSQLAGSNITFSADPAALRRAKVIIVAVPTPIDSHRNPDLNPLKLASRLVGQNLSPGAVVVYESTVYPGVTEDICAPILARESGLTLGQDFFIGYSPERINPGDREHTLKTVAKVVAGIDEQTSRFLTALYGQVVEAGIHTAPSIKVAEAAKVIENTQRDLNIALMNELALIFGKLGLDTQEVLKAAASKWNFLPFQPGLVGGHCIGVDPYYLTYRAEELGYHPQVILAGRRINDSMGKYVAEVTVKTILTQGCVMKGARVGVLGLSFKENVPDLRNSRVVDIISELEDYGAQVLVHDPLASARQAKEEYGLRLSPLNQLTGLKALILAVPHDYYLRNLNNRIIRSWFDLTAGEKIILMDVKGAWPEARRGPMDETVIYWRL